LRAQPNVRCRDRRRPRTGTIIFYLCGWGNRQRNAGSGQGRHSQSRPSPISYRTISWPLPFEREFLFFAGIGEREALLAPALSLFCSPATRQRSPASPAVRCRSGVPPAPGPVSFSPSAIYAPSRFPRRQPLRFDLGAAAPCEPLYRPAAQTGLVPCSRLSPRYK